MTVELNPFTRDAGTFAAIGSAFTVTLGKMLDGGREAAEGAALLPYVRAGNIQDAGLDLSDANSMPFTPAEAANLDLRAGDVLVVEGGAVGTSVVLGEDMPGWSFQKTVNRLRCSGDWTPKYVSYVLTAYRDAGVIDIVCNKSTIPHLTAEKLRALRVPAWEPSRQRAIADYLDKETAQIDTLIAEQERFIEIQRERRDAVIDRGVFGLDAAEGDVRDLRVIGRHRAVEPLLRAVPKTWRVERFKAVLVRLDERNVDLDFPMMSLKSTGEIVPRSSTGERQEPDESSLPRYLVARVDDLVVNPMWLIGGAIGVSRVAGAVSPDYRVFRSRGGHHPRYLHHLLRSRPYRDQYVLYTRAQTTFDRRVQQPDLDNVPLPVPPLAEQALIADRIDRTIAKIDAMIAETQSLISLAKERRSALITAAVTGQIDVRSAAV